MSESVGNQRIPGRQAVATSLVQESCPICGTSYQHSSLVEQPTCGDPNCVRAARQAGKPFAVKPRPLPTKPPKDATRRPSRRKMSR